MSQTTATRGASDTADAGAGMDCSRCGEEFARDEPGVMLLSGNQFTGQYVCVRCHQPGERGVLC